MAKCLFINAAEARSGKSAIVLGVMQGLLRDIRRVAYFRPVICPEKPDALDHNVHLMLSYFDLDMAPEDAYVYTLDEVRDLMNSGKHEQVLDKILEKYKYLESKYDFVLCEGLDYLGKNVSLEFDLNADIASNIGAPMLLVVRGIDKSADDIISTTQVTLDALDEKGINVIACIINRATVAEIEESKIACSLQVRKNSPLPLITFVMPEVPALGKPTIADVKDWLGADVVFGAERMNILVQDILIAAMQAGNFMTYIQPGALVVTPGDRSDIILAALASRLSSEYPDIAGIVLTGGIKVSPSISKLIAGWTGVSVPILSVKEHTFKTAQAISALRGKIDPKDTRRVNAALGHFESCVDVRAITQRLGNLKSSKITPKMFEFNLLERAAQQTMRIVLPESKDERILRATDILCRRHVAEVILLGKEDEIATKMADLGLDFKVQIIDPEKYHKFDEYVVAYHAARSKKGISMELARDTMLDPTYFATMMVQQGDADGMVSGAIHTTAHTIRPAFEFVKTKPGVSIVSSVFLMCLKDRVLVFGDCAVNPNPTSDQLADIAISSAATAEIFGIEPKVAMLSYSTGVSGKGADVDIVVEATRLAQERAPELLLEGPLQYDAAIDKDVAATKLPNSKVAGQATVFIFPDLNTGNNTYKAVQRAAGAVAIGPVLQGLNKPVNDLSRGCTVADIVNTVAITAVQAQAERAKV